MWAMARPERSDFNAAYRAASATGFHSTMVDPAARKRNFSITLGRRVGEGCRAFNLTWTRPKTRA